MWILGIELNEHVYEYGLRLLGNKLKQNKAKQYLFYSDIFFI